MAAALVPPQDNLPGFVFPASFSASAAITAYRAVGFLSLFSGFSSPRFSLLPLTTSSSVHGSQSPLSIDAELPISLPEENNHSCDTGASALYEASLQMGREFPGLSASDNDKRYGG